MGSNIHEYQKAERRAELPEPSVTLSMESALGLTGKEIADALTSWPGTRMQRILSWIVREKIHQRTLALASATPADLIGKQQEIHALREVLPMIDRPVRR
jgi:hypothetical protein